MKPVKCRNSFLSIKRVKDSQRSQKYEKARDGSHIRILFFTFIWKFCPELIEKGYVYAAVPPLYRIIKGNKSFYIKDDNALAEYRKKHSGDKYELRRFKG